MRRHGIDLRDRCAAKHLQEFATQRVDFVIRRYDRVREVWPEFPGHPNAIHWRMAETALETRSACERTAVKLERCIRFLFHVIHQETTIR